MRKFIIPLTLGLAFAMSAQAVSIGRASSVSVSRPATVSAPKPAAPAPSRIGGGQSAGMTRPDVMQQARQPVPTPAPVAPAQRQYSPATPAPVPVTGSTGPSAGSMFAATAGGALLGTVVGNAISGPHGSTTVVAGGGGAALPAGVAGPTVVSTGYGAGSGFMSFLGFLLILLGGAALILFAIRMYQRSQKPAASRQPFFSETRFVNEHAAADTTMPFQPVARFLAIQNLFAQGNRIGLQERLGPDMHQLLDTMPEHPDTDAKHTLGPVSYEVLDHGAALISVRYRSLDYSTDGGPVDEVWHFTRSPAGDWLLNGIEQV